MILYNKNTWITTQDKIYHNGKKIIGIYKGTKQYYPIIKPNNFYNLEKWAKKLSYGAQIRVNYNNGINYVSVDTKLHSYELLVIDIRNIVSPDIQYKFSFDMSHSLYTNMTGYGYDHGFIFSGNIPTDTRLDNHSGKIAETERFEGSKTELQEYSCTFNVTSALLSKPLYAIISFWCVDDNTYNTTFEISNLKIEEIIEE